jgi:DNA-binding NtrC family response regulator
MRVLVVEDEPRLREMLVSAIPTMGFETFAARSGEDGLRAMEEHPCEMVVLDLNLPGMDGLEFFERMREKWPLTQVVVVTGFGDLDAAKKAIRLNVADFLTKPTPLGDLEQALDRARRKWVQAMQTDETMLRPLPDLSQSEPVAEKDADAAESQPIDETQPATLEEIERRHILAALDRNNGNRAATAKELGISVRKLYYRISQYQDEGRI